MNMNKLSSFLLCAAFALCLTATNLTAAGPATVALGNAGHFAVLAGTSVTNAGHSVINGDLGVAPGTSVTGFKPVPLAGPGVVNGTIYTPLKYCTPKACVTQSNTAAADGQASLLVAYNDAAGRTVGVVGVAGDLGGTTLTPGLYNSTSTLAITGDLTLNGAGVYIFQMASGLTVNSNARVVLTGGATAANVFWQVGSTATLGSTSVFEGNILAFTEITMGSGATVSGRALAMNADVTFISNVVTIPTTSKGGGGKGH